MILLSLAILFLVVINFDSVYSNHCETEENFPKCDRLDNNCINNQLEPYLRAWMLKGQPGYFLESLNPISFPELTIPTSKGLYQLQNVKITGFPEAKFLNNKYDPDHGQMQFAFEFNFDLTAGGFIDAKGQSLLTEGPLIVHLDDLYVESKTEMTLVERCRNNYIKFHNSHATVREGDVVFKSGMQNPEKELKHALAQIVGKASLKKVAENYRQIARIIPAHVFWT